VTTMVDAGSSGWRNFEFLRTTVIDRAKTRVLALINIAGLGMITDAVEQADFNPDEVARLARKHRDVVVGVKSAHYQSPDWKSVDQAVAAGRAAGIPIMVDFGYFLPERPYWRLVTEHLRPGDISTHCFRAPAPWVDEKGKLYEYFHKARARGVIFDVGHGGGSFVFRNAVPAVAQGFYPDSISTDLHHHVEVSGHGHAARRGHPAVHLESGSHHPASRTRPPDGRRGRGHRRLEGDGRRLRIRRRQRRQALRQAAADL